MKNIQLTSVLVFLVWGLFACSPAADDETEALGGVASKQSAHREQLPAFAMIDAAGNAVNLSSFKGKKVFVNLWATWCPPCRVEIPSIEALAAKADKDVVFVMLSLDKDFDIARRFSAKTEMKVPIYYPAADLPALFNVEGIPATFVFDEQGRLIKEISGSDDYNTDSYVRLLAK